MKKKYGTVRRPGWVILYQPGFDTTDRAHNFKFERYTCHRARGYLTQLHQWPFHIYAEELQGDNAGWAMRSTTECDVHTLLGRLTCVELVEVTFVLAILSVVACYYLVMALRGGGRERWGFLMSLQLERSSGERRTMGA